MNHKSAAIEDLPGVPPAPEKSGVRISSKPPVYTREEVASLLGGRFKNMHFLSAKTHERFGLMQYEENTRTARFPTLHQAAASFTAEEMELAATYQKPALILTPPGWSSEELFQKLNTRFAGRASSPMIRNKEEFNFPLEDDYRAFIVEGANRISPQSFDRLSLPMAERLQLRAQAKHEFEWAMTEELYALLAMQSAVRGSAPMDQRNYTILDGESVVADQYYPVGYTKEVRDEDGYIHTHPGTLDWLPEHQLETNRVRFRRVLGATSPIELDAA